MNDKCGRCEAEIDGGDFCSEECQQRWHRERLGLEAPNDLTQELLRRS